jgi:hypothetical protein
MLQSVLGLQWAEAEPMKGWAKTAHNWPNEAVPKGTMRFKWMAANWAIMLYVLENV